MIRGCGKLSISSVGQITGVEGDVNFFYIGFYIFLHNRGGKFAGDVKKMQIDVSECKLFNEDMLLFDVVIVDKGTLYFIIPYIM